MNSRPKSFGGMRFGRAIWIALTFCAIGSFGAGGAAAQDPEQYAVDKAQSDIRQKLIRYEGGRRPDVYFDRNPDVSQLSNAETKVTGTGRYRTDENDQGKTFQYQAVVNIRSGKVVNSDYKLTSEGNNSGGSNDPETTTIAKVQDAVAEKFKREQRGLIYFEQTPEMYQVSNAENGVRGVASYRRNVDDNDPREVEYEGVYNTRTGRVTSVKYRIK